MPFAGFTDFADCVSQNQDKDSPEGFCAYLHWKTTGRWPTEASKEAIKYAKEVKMPEVKAKKTRTFEGVEIARTGTFEAQTGRVKFTTQDFDNAEEAYKELGEKHHAVIKLGHDEHHEQWQHAVQT